MNAGTLLENVAAELQVRALRAESELDGEK